MAVLTTASFEALASMQARALGDDQLDLIVVEHPIGGVTAQELERRCERACEQAVSWLRWEAERRQRG